MFIEHNFENPFSKIESCCVLQEPGWIDDMAQMCTWGISDLPFFQHMPRLLSSLRWLYLFYAL
jgi:hypothetical protein